MHIYIFINGTKDQLLFSPFHDIVLFFFDYVPCLLVLFLDGGSESSANLLMQKCSRNVKNYVMPSRLRLEHYVMILTILCLLSLSGSRTGPLNHSSRKKVQQLVSLSLSPKITCQLPIRVRLFNGINCCFYQ